MRVTPYYCHCKRCHHEWKTKQRGGGHKYPLKCANVNCGSPYHDYFPQRYSIEGFNFERDSNKTSDGKVCDKCMQDWIAHIRSIGGMRPLKIKDENKPKRPVGRPRKNPTKNPLFKKRSKNNKGDNSEED